MVNHQGPSQHVRKKRLFVKTQGIVNWCKKEIPKLVILMGL